MNLSFDGPKTREFLGAIGTLGLIENKKRAKTLIVDSLDNANLILSSRNVQKTKVTNSFGLNIYDIIYHEKLVDLEGGGRRAERPARSETRKRKEAKQSQRRQQKKAESEEGREAEGRREAEGEAAGQEAKLRQRPKKRDRRKKQLRQRRRRTMSKLGVWDILKSPVVTEKSVILKEDSTEENSGPQTGPGPDISRRSKRRRNLRSRVPSKRSLT